MRLVAGTFTGGFMGGEPSEGLYIFELDRHSRSVELIQTIGDLFSPSYLAQHPTLPVLYAVERQWSATDTVDGALSAFSFENGSNLLAARSRIRSGGAFTAHVNVSDNGSLIAIANPLGPTASVFALEDDGAIGDQIACLGYSGIGARTRQSAPWPHSCWFTPNGGQMFVCDLGLDRIHLYDIESLDGNIAENSFEFAQVSSGAGARHMAIRPQGDFAAVANELDGTLSVFSIDPERRNLTIVQTVETAGPCTECQPAEIKVSANGRFLYVTLRGENMIGIFNWRDDGKLCRFKKVPARGDTPRHIGFSRDGKMAFVSNQLSSEICIFDADLETGELVFSGTKISVPSPSCVVSIDS